MSLTSFRDYSRYPNFSMPGETRTSRYSSVPRSSGFNVSSTSTSSSTRGTSLERRKSYGINSTNISSSSKSITKPAERRPLPAGPRPLDANGRKLSDFKTKRSSPTGSTLRNAQVKTDYTSKNLYTSSYSDVYGSSAKAKSPENENYGVSATSSTTVRRRSLTSFRDYSRYPDFSMPGETRTSRYNSVPRSSGFNVSSTSTSASTRGTSLERRKSYGINSTNITKPTERRPLPAGPGPLDANGRKLSDFKTKRSSPTGSTLRNGPVKVDYTSKNLYTSSYSDAYGSSAQAKSPQNENYGVSATSSTTVRKRSPSISSLTDSTREMKLNGGREDTYMTPRSRDLVDRTLSRGSRKDSYNFENNTSDTLWSSSSRTNKTSVYENGSTKSDIGRPPSGRRRESSHDLVHDSYSNSSLSSNLSSKYYNAGKCGLRNLGNTCFMNSVLQCLSNTKPLLEYCLKEDYLLDKNTTTSSLKGQLITAYAKLMESMWKDKDSSVSPNSFKTQIQRFAPRFMGYAQQDSQEFLRYLLEGLHEDVNRVTKKPKPVSIQDEDFPQDKEKGQEYWKVYLTYDNSHIVDIFVGQLKSELKYRDCGHKSTTFDPFWDLSVPIPKGKSDVSLNSCINLFMREEQLDHDERPTCSKCKKRSDCTKSFSIQRFPNILVIHFKRFSQGRYSQKVSTFVNFPESLDLTEYSSERGSGKTIYSLYAVSNHSGSVHSGHYTACCKHPYNGEWFSFNDARASSTSARFAVSSEAYLVFYELTSRSSRL